MGYQTVEVPGNNYKALAVQFENVGETTAIAVKDLVSYSNPLGGGAIGAGADQIWRWNATKMDWDKYFYRAGRGVETPGWCKAGETTETTDTIAAGETAFFFRYASSAATLTLSGGVKPLTDSTSYAVYGNNYSFMGYPWPAAFKISDMASCYSEGTPLGGGAIGAGADQIWRWNTAKMDWDKYFYRAGRGVETPGWCKAGETTITDDTIPAGEGFFFFRYATTGVTITFTAPEAE